MVDTFFLFVETGEKTGYFKNDGIWLKLHIFSYEIKGKDHTFVCVHGKMFVATVNLTL